MRYDLYEYLLDIKVRLRRDRLKYVMQRYGMEAYTCNEKCRKFVGPWIYYV